MTQGSLRSTITAASVSEWEGGRSGSGSRWSAGCTRCPICGRRCARDGSRTNRPGSSRGRRTTRLWRSGSTGRAGRPALLCAGKSRLRKKRRFPLGATWTSACPHGAWRLRGRDSGGAEGRGEVGYALGMPPAYRRALHRGLGSGFEGAQHGAKEGAQAGQGFLSGAWLQPRGGARAPHHPPLTGRHGL